LQITLHPLERSFMKKSRVRLVVSILIILILGGVAAFELKDALAPDESVDAQLRGLKSYWASRRREAATALKQFPGSAEQVVPQLVDALHDSDAEVRENAFQSLHFYGAQAKSAGPALREMLKHDPDAKTRQHAAALLGSINDRDAIPALSEALDDRDPGVRLEATVSLGMLGPAGVSDAIVARLLSTLGADHPEDLRGASVGTLHSLAKDQERVARAIADVAAKDASADVRYKAVGIMKMPKFPFQVPALVAALEDPNPRVRLIAGTNLAYIGMTDDRTVPALCRAAQSADDVTREGIGINFDLLILERATDKTPPEQMARRFQTAVRELQTVVESPKAAARDHAMNVLARIILYYQSTGKPFLLDAARSAVRAVLARFEDEQEALGLRLHAINEWSLIKLHLPRPAASRSAPAPSSDELHAGAAWIAAMGRALKSPAVAVRSRAAEILLDALNERGTDPSFRAAWRGAVPLLAAATHGQDDKVRVAALAILNRLGPDAADALPVLRSLVTSTEEPAIRSAAESAIKSITVIDDLKAKDPDARVAAAGTLGLLGWAATPHLPALIAALADPEAKVRAAAAQAFGALGDSSTPAVPPLAAKLSDDPDAGVRAAIVTALEAIAPGTPAVLAAHLHALRDPDPAVRKAAATFAKVPADDSAVSALEAALGDPDDEVRLKVAESLTEILFESPEVIPALCKGFRNDLQRKTLVAALENHLENTADAAEFSRVRGNGPKLRTTLGTAVPKLKEALSQKNEELRPVVFALLGRIVSFARATRDNELHKAIEPALQLYLEGLEENDPAIRAEVLGRLDRIPIGREEIVAAVQKLLKRSDLPAADRETAERALKAPPDITDAPARRPSRRD
jgi:HEAT repeat protein